MTKKALSTVAVVTLTTGIMLSRRMDDVNEAADQIMGHPVWTQELPGYQARMIELVHAQYPDFPTEIGDEGFEAMIRELETKYSAMIEIERGTEERVAVPMTTLAGKIADKH